MAVNESVYGLSGTWYDSDFQQAALPNKNKTACFDSTQGVPWSSLGLGVDAGKLSWSEPIDKSLSYCGLGRESSFSTVCYYDNSGQIIDVNERTVTNFAFFEKSNDTPTLSDNTFFNTNYLDYFTWQTANTLNRINFSRQLKPLTLVNPKNIVLSIFIRATTNNLTGDIDVTLKNYLENYKSTHTLIKDVYLKFWYGNISEIGIRETLPFKYLDNRRPFMIAILDDYEMTSKNIKFNAYDIDSPSIFGVISLNNYIGVNDTTSFRMIYCTPTAKDHIVFRTFNDAVYAYIEYYPEFDEDIIKSVACFGLYFTPNDSICQLGALTNNDMYIGLLDSNGIGHGDYLRGSQTVNAPQNNYTDMSEAGYDYQKSTDDTKYTNNTLFYGTWSSQAFTKMYVLTASEVSLLANELYTAVSQAPQGEEIERYNQSVFLTQNPIDCIISLKKFPMELPFSASVPIKLGSYTCQQATGAPLLYSTGVYTFTFSRGAQNSLKDWFEGSFLDYEPYTKVELSIPFCGTVEIPCCYLYQYDTLYVKLIVDFITGACTAYVLSRDITIDSVSGECAVNLPVNGVQAANLDAQIYSAAANRNKSAFSSGLGLIGGLATMGIGIATGGIAAAVAGGIAALASGTNLVTQDKKIEYELQHMQLPLKQISAASGAISQSYDMRCKMRITRPKLDPDFDPEVYVDTVGFACLMQGQVKDFTGLTVGDIDLDGVAAPEPVKKMLQSLFAEGVYL